MSRPRSSALTLPYTHFWHHYVQQHAGQGGSHVAVDPGSAIGAALCLLVIGCWAWYQIQARCGDCGAIPARCRCQRGRVPGG